MKQPQPKNNSKQQNAHQNDQKTHPKQAKRNASSPVVKGLSTRRGEVLRMAQMKSSDIKQRSSQHLSSLPVNKSRFNGRGGKQASAIDNKKIKHNPEAVRVIPIGGLAEGGIGNNMTAIEYKDEMIIIDMGSIFPSSDDYPGVALMTPDSEYLRKNKHKLKAILFTHAHLDHIGACRYLLSEFPAPVYATPFTIEMIKRQMTESVKPYEPEYIAVHPQQHNQIKLGKHLSVEFIHVLHSIPGCTALAIRTPNGTIVHMGDWRFEEEPIHEPFDMARLEEISRTEGIDLMLNESTNIDKPGTHPHSEQTVAKNIGTVLEKYHKSRVIASCFSSQLYRIQLLLDEAVRHGRKVAFAGFSMISNIEVAIRAHEIKVPEGLIVKLQDTTSLPDGQVMIICTGSQGESNAVLARMATGAHRFIKIKSPDCIVMSSSPIPGNEPSVSAVISNLLREGATVIQDGRTHQHGIGPIYLSGHAYYDDHVKLVRTLKPRSYVPIHGEFYMLQHNAEMAEKEGIPTNNILVVDDGDVVEMAKDGSIKTAGRVSTSSTLRDNKGREVNEAVIRDRLLIGNDGIFTIVIAASKRDGRLLKPADIISRACVYLQDSQQLCENIRRHIRHRVNAKTLQDIEGLRKELMSDIGHIIYDETSLSPLVTIVINRV